MDDIICLLNATGTPTVDDSGNEVQTFNRNSVFCEVRSVTRSEFYQASQQGLHPSVTFVLSDHMDYNGEKMLEWTDPKGKKITYEVIRVYHNPDTGEVELTAEERIGNGGNKYSS